MIPFLKEAETYLNFKYSKVVADAGYESEENYRLLEKNGQTAFIKPANCEISKKRKYHKDIGRIENMTYDKKKDVYICKNEKELPLSYVNKPHHKIQKGKTGTHLRALKSA